MLPSNACPTCLKLFGNRAQAIKHVQEQPICRVNLATWHEEMSTEDQEAAHAEQFAQEQYNRRHCLHDEHSVTSVAQMLSTAARPAKLWSSAWSPAHAMHVSHDAAASFYSSRVSRTAQDVNVPARPQRCDTEPD